MIGDIMTISRLRMGTDGKGVSTLVTFFDCPLHCKYCINNFCHKKDSFIDSIPKFFKPLDSSLLDGKDLYGDSVPRGAYTPEQLIQVLRKDDIYYRMSGGGVVFGGGEPLLQSSFIHEVCKLADPAWKKRIETSLNVPWRYVEPIINDMDEWIIDMKDMDSRIYEEYTGVSIKDLMDNIFRLKNLVDSSRLHIRIPHIPGFNNEKNVEESVKWIRDVLEVEPEVFDYFKPVEKEENQTLTIPPFLQ